MDKTKVAVMRCGSYGIEELTEKIEAGAAQLGGWESMLAPGMNVLLKVNLISPMPPESAAVTHCEFVRAAARIVKSRGCNVWIGDSSGGAINGKAQTGKAFDVSGLTKVAQEEGALIKNFDREGVVEIKTRSGKSMFLAKPVFDADFVINLPKLKTHIAGVFTGAVKNLYGCIPGLKKAEYHKAAQSARALGAVICDLNEAVKPGLHIMDGVIAMDGHGPVSGNPYKAEKILLSRDPLALDSVVVSMTGLSVDKLPIFAESVERGIGKWKMEDIEVCGDFSSPPRLTGFKVPRALVRESENSKALGRIIDFMKVRPEMDMSACRKCNVCVESCPVEAIDKETKKIDYDKCIECMCCHEMCVYKAVRLVNVNRVMRLLSKLKRKK